MTARIRRDGVRKADIERAIKAVAGAWKQGIPAIVEFRPKQGIIAIVQDQPQSGPVAPIGEVVL
jgi:hypothetical protein